MKNRRDRKKTAKARFIEEMKNAASRSLRAPPTREEFITNALTTNGKLTYSGQSLIDKILWDFEAGYADCTPFGSSTESAADTFCKCTFSEVCTWKAGLGGALNRETRKPSVAILLRFYLETFQDFFAESRRLESERDWEEMVPLRRGSEELKERFWQKAKEDFVEALWDHLCTAEGWE